MLNGRRSDRYRTDIPAKRDRLFNIPHAPVLQVSLSLNQVPTAFDRLKTLLVVGLVKPLHKRMVVRVDGQHLHRPMAIVPRLQAEADLLGCAAPTTELLLTTLRRKACAQGYLFAKWDRPRVYTMIAGMKIALDVVVEMRRTA